MHIVGHGDQTFKNIHGHLVIIGLEAIGFELEAFQQSAYFSSNDNFIEDVRQNCILKIRKNQDNIGLNPGPRDLSPIPTPETIIKRGESL